jgi:hypothetical protein
MNLDDVEVVGVVAPDLGKQLVFGGDETASADEVGKEPQLGRGQHARRAGPGGEAGLLVHDYLAGFNGGAKSACPAEHNPYPGKQLFEREGLDEIVVGSGAEAANAILDGVFGGEDKDVGVGAVVAEAAKEGEAVEAGEHEIEDDDVIFVALGEPETLGAVGGEVDGVAAVAQAAGDGALKALRVLDVQDAHEGKIQ